MYTVPKASFSDFENSALSACFIIDNENGEYRVKMHSELPSRTDYLIGSLGNPHGTPELFRLLLPIPLAIGNRGTILNLSNTAMKLPYPTFVKQSTNADGYHVISRHFGAPTFRVGRLMALSWLSRPEGTTEVDHIDGDPSHDELNNLEWVTHGENLRRGRHSKPKGWNLNDRVLMVKMGCDLKLVHPSEVSSIIGCRNSSHVLRRGTRRSANGWYMCLNPSRADAINFVNSLPFEDISCYTTMVEELFDVLGID